MTAINPFGKKMALSSGLPARLLFVVVAFTLMVVASCTYAGNMLHNHLRVEADNMLAQTKLRVESNVLTAETMLEIVAENIIEIIEHDGNADDVLAHLQMKNLRLQESLGYSSVRGYFDVFGGVYLDGSSWKPPASWQVQERPWYQAAVEANGGIGIVPIYQAAHSNQYEMAYSLCIFDEDGNRLFVLALNVPLAMLNQHMSGIGHSENSYGILESAASVIMAHPNPEFIGQNMSEINADIYSFANEVREGKDLVEHTATNYREEKVVVFTSLLKNDWVVSVVIPQSEYYWELTQMTIIISAFGVFLAAALIVILIGMDKNKRRVDEMAQQQKGLLEQSKSMQLMLDAMPIGCKLWNENLEIISCNEACVRLFGTKDKQEFIDRFFDFSPEYQPCGRLSKEMAAESIPKALEEGFLRFEWMHNKMNGEPMPAEITMVRVAYQDEHVVAAYIRDLTEHNQMLGELNSFTDKLRLARDEAEHANHAKSAFLANMSHEMRTPLSVVIGLTDLHMEEELESWIMGDIKKINTAGNTLLSIVNDVLDISKIEAGKIELVPIIFNTASFFNDVVTLNIIRIESKPIVFNVKIDEKVPEEIFGDELRLKQMLNNLLSNAFKYTHEGSVTLSVSCHQEGNDDLWMHVTVSDTGIGMSPKDLERLFTDYNQVNTKANRKIEGTGLGLSITKKMAELMDGSIEVESELSKGSTFYLKIKLGFVSSKPLDKETIEKLRDFSYADTKQHVSAKLVRADLSYAKVLVVDDVQTNLDVASGMMKKYKMQVDCVTSGQAAINRIKSQEPLYDAVFMDHMMPEMDGIETTQRIRALGTEYAQGLTIISLTANAIAGNEQMFLDSGFQAFLSKPIDMLKLDMVLRQWVKDKTKEAAQKAAREAAAEAAREPAMTLLSPRTEEESSFVEINIPGIDEHKGLAFYGQDQELYIPVLQSYAANTPAIIKSLRGVNDKSLPSYAINVHGLKGSSGSIGAEAVREQAARMEAAAKAGDLSTVLEHNEALLKDTEELVCAIREWFSAQAADDARPELAAPDPTLLDDLQRCCEQFNMNGVDEAMEQLERARYTTHGELITWLREKVDISDFGAIVLRLGEYKEESS